MALTFANEKEERAFRRDNPLDDYTKEVEMRFLNRTADALKNNTGVSQAQLNQYNDLTSKWNYNTNPFDENKFRQDMMDQQKGYLDNMFNQQKEAQMAQLNASRDKALGQINQQKSQVAPQYQGMRNQTDAVNMQNVQRLREVMANAGLTASGENVSANAAMNNQRLNSINALNLQEQQTMDDFERRIADLNNPAEEQALMAAIEAERSRAMMDAFNRSTDMGYQRSRDAIGDKRYENEFDYNKGRDARRDAEWESDTKYNRGWQEQLFDYQKSRDARSDAEWESQQKTERAWREFAFNNMSASEKAHLEWAKSQYGEDAAWRMYALQYQGELDRSTNQAQLDFYKNAGFNSSGGGGGGSVSYGKNNPPKTFQNHMQAAVGSGKVPAAWVSGLTELIKRESSWNPTAKNPKSTAHGYGQFLKSTRANYEKKMGLSYSDPVNQIIMTAQYVKDRYGTIDKALAFWDKNKWY